MSSNDYARGITSGVMAVGGSLAVGFTSGPQINSVMFQYLSGGTCSLVGISTMTQGYLLTAGIPVSFGGPVSLYLNSLSGTTSLVQFIKIANVDPVNN